MPDKTTVKTYKPTIHDTIMPNTIYLRQPHPYGYQINILSPEIHPLFIAYRKEIGEPLHFPISDAQRLEFERRVLTGCYPVQLQRAPTRRK